MYSYRGRGGPRQATPTNVQCQKCLKRGHYSYECKESSQARPYVPRPSRTQQLLNPNLMPKLTNDTPDDSLRKKGIADEELAKKEAERARKRELEERDEELIRQTDAKRRRSESVDSVSTISTNRSASPPARRRSPSPVPARRRQRSPEESKGSRRRSLSPESDGDGSVSRRSPMSRQTQSPPRRHQRSLSPGSRSPPATHNRRYRERDEDYVRPTVRPSQERQPARDTSDSRESSISRSGDIRDSRRSLSRSPHRRGPRFEGRSDRGGERGQGYRGGPKNRLERSGRNDRPERGSEKRQPERERSLSPFSKRLALTQSLNMGR
ncbi:uncharacterized protein CTRU02_200086 [Colletotrichum truncatum]|uniref:Uncharacterized protein n=1 Tax=Colletotrichum truncatum TaxID=5467 RepID=A0ACC3ZDL6_COLTU|nr:uncharacterized protein CTRU02_04961 [Colletotrichum truncatum]KAF6794760.1 hypothetical protein CTRU02_04961 [Colletotrichum truncatum]